MLASCTVLKVVWNALVPSAGATFVHCVFAREALVGVRAVLTRCSYRAVILFDQVNCCHCIVARFRELLEDRAVLRPRHVLEQGDHVVAARTEARFTKGGVLLKLISPVLVSYFSRLLAHNSQCEVEGASCKVGVRVF